MSLPLVTKFPRGSSKGLITRSGETRMNSETLPEPMATSRGCRRRTLLDAGPIQNGMDPPHQDLTAEYAALYNYPDLLTEEELAAARQRLEA